MYPTYKYFKRNYVHELALYIYETATLVLTYLVFIQTFILSLIQCTAGDVHMWASVLQSYQFGLIALVCSENPEDLCLDLEVTH